MNCDLCGTYFVGAPYSNVPVGKNPDPARHFCTTDCQDAFDVAKHQIVLARCERIAKLTGRTLFDVCNDSTKPWRA